MDLKKNDIIMIKWDERNIEVGLVYRKTKIAVEYFKLDQSEECVFGPELMNPNNNEGLFYTVVDKCEKIGEY